MAPTVTNGYAALLPRQSEIANSTSSAVSPAPTGGLPPTPPPCVGNCFVLGDQSDCANAGFGLQACLCQSVKFIQSVDRCFASSCSADDAKTGDDYAHVLCNYVGIDLATVTSGAAAPTTSVDLTTPPVVTYQTFVNLQAIMSSICSLLLVIALVLGFLACRSRARRDHAAQSGSWTNMATYATGPGGTTKGGVSRPGASAGGGMGNKSFGGGGSTSRFGKDDDFDPTATFASSSYGPGVVRSLSYGGTAGAGAGPTVSFGEVGENLAVPKYTHAGALGRGMGGGRGMSINRGFTNRLTLEEEDVEEWEMKEKKSVNRDVSDAEGEEKGPVSASGSGSSAGSKEGSKNGSTDSIVLGAVEPPLPKAPGLGDPVPGPSPTTPTTRMGRAL